jgi:hypothetical protein
MTAWELYDQGPIEVAGSGYTNIHDAPLEGLDEVVVEMPHVDLTLDYPFDNPYEAVVEGGPDGVTLRQIIDAVRRGFGEMYASTTETATALPGNPEVAGKYGVAFHPIRISRRPSAIS